MMIKDEIIKSLSGFLRENSKKYNIIKMGVFGSVARGNLSEKSDIDIVVELGTPDFLNLISIKQELENRLHHSIDIVRYRDKMNSYLKHKIDNEAIYV